jgi:hypothetical protein
VPHDRQEADGIYIQFWAQYQLNEGPLQESKHSTEARVGLLISWLWVDECPCNCISLVLASSNYDELLNLYIKTIQTQYFVVRSVNFRTTDEPKIKQVDPLLDAHTLGFQTSLLTLTMKSNAKRALEEPKDENPLTKLWQKVGQNAFMMNWLDESLKLTNIAVTAVFGNVKDKQTFSTLEHMKLKLHNGLGYHLNTCMKIFA